MSATQIQAPPRGLTVQGPLTLWLNSSLIVRGGGPHRTRLFWPFTQKGKLNKSTQRQSAIHTIDLPFITEWLLPVRSWHSCHCVVPLRGHFSTFGSSESCFINGHKINGKYLTLVEEVKTLLYVMTTGKNKKSLSTRSGEYLSQSKRKLSEQLDKECLDY